MRFSTIFLSTVVAALSVQAQANNGTVTTEPAVSGTQLPTPAQQSAAACLEKCSPDNNDCRAECHALANSVNPIADCQAKCPKGDGTAAENEFYKQCFIGCQTTATEAPATTPKPTGTDSTSKPTGAAGSGDDSSDDSKDDSKDGSDDDSNGSDVKATGTATTEAPGATQTGASNNLGLNLAVGGGLGLFALMAAL